jgi:pyruvate/2-oxoglutarate dehydrogenase complex dihydrolipoamide dehydrogenase (E3) component
MNTNETYDALVIGSGQAGTPLSRTLAEAGLRTALIEREHVGGTCINEGCTPTKTMIASARVAYLARRGADFGVFTGSLRIDMNKVRQRKRNIVNSFRNGSQARLEKTNGLDLIFGEARFIGPKTVHVALAGGTPEVKTAERVLTADKIFINAGTRASVPRLAGIDGVALLTNKSIMELDAVPEHLLVLGGGYIGVEFGQMFRRFGSRVTIVQSGPRLLAGEDGDVSDEVAKILREDGIEVLLDAKADRVSQSGGKISLGVVVGGTRQTLEGSHLLVATGRVPNSDTLDVKAAGIATDARGWIQSNSRLETSVPGVWALGDIKGGPMFTHISYDDYRVVKWNVLERKDVTIDGRIVPYTLFMDPELGRVGMTEEEASKSGKKIRVFKMPTNKVARALEVDESRGFWKAVVDQDSGQILGAAILGIEGGEVMALIETAMLGKLPYTRLRDGVWAHPTLAEGVNNLFA